MTMAESTLDEAQTAPVQDKLINNHNNNNNNNNNHPMVANHNHRPGLVKQRKRKRLSQVLDKLTGAKDEETKQNLCNNNNNINNNNNNNNNDDEMNNLKNKKLYPSNNNNNNNNVDASVFKFDNLLNNNNNIIKQQNEEEDVFSPASSSNKSPHSSTESPRISFSPLRIKDSPSPPLLLHHQQPHRPPICPCYQCAVSGSTHQHQHHHHHFQHPPSPLHHPYDRFFPASSPIAAPSSSSSPPAPNYNFERYLHSKYLPDIFRRRSHSDSDLPLWLEKNQTENKPSSSWCHHHQVPLPIISSSVIINNETTEIPSTQEFPLDLSMKNKSAATFVKNSSSSREKKVLPPSSSSSVAPHQLLPSGFLPPRGSSSSSVSVSVVKGDVASPTTKESVATRYNLEVSPVVEEMPPGSDVAFVCPVCGQMFSLHDRLAKHMASRHKSRQNASEQTAKAYLCDVCKRSFARSDMLTRHMRLHTGIKPYTCRVCGQVFSRSDHLSTHQRTHTGEKPYKCPQCPYAACRRDMITRHMRTHTRYEPDNLNTSVKTEINH